MNKIAIYGAGQYGRAFYKALNAKQIKVDFFIDEYTPSKECYGKPIYRIISSEPAKVYISVFQDNDSIKGDLEKAGFEDIVEFRDTLIEFPDIT